ncbi:MAG: hypothetical protein [Phage AS32]|nr:MAG: hypothetical protein [Phage AS32]
MTFADVKSAVRMRELITNIAEGVVNRLRPEDRIGKVFSYNKTTQTARIWFPGETTSSLVSVHFALDKIPSKSMDSSFDSAGYDAPGDIVRVAGKPGAYFILDYVSGLPQDYSLDPITNGVFTNPHSNPSFDIVVTSTYGNANETTVPARLVPQNWRFHSGDAGTNGYSSDTETWNGASGYALKMDLNVANKQQRAYTSIFSAKEGSIVTVKVKVKANGPKLELGVMTGTSNNFGFFDGDPNTEWFSSGDIAVPTDEIYREYSFQAVVGTGRTKAYISLRGSSAVAGAAGEIWFDECQITVDESGIITSRDLIATENLRGKQLYVNQRRIYEAPVLGEQFGIWDPVISSNANDDVLRTIYIKDSGLVIPAGTRSAVISMEGGAQAAGNCACYWYGLANVSGAGYINHRSTRRHSYSNAAYSLNFHHTFEVNIPATSPTLAIAVNATTDPGGLGMTTHPGGWSVIYKG